MDQSAIGRALRPRLDNHPVLGEVRRQEEEHRLVQEWASGGSRLHPEHSQSAFHIFKWLGGKNQSRITVVAGSTVCKI